MKKLSLWLLIFLLPTQLGFHFWPSFSLVSGFKIDYLSPTIYLIDLFLITYFIFSLRRHKPSFSRHPALDARSVLKPLTPLFILILLNIVFANQPLLSLFFWGKLSLYFLLPIALFRVHDLKKLIYSPLLVSTFLIIGIQFAQLFLQKSLGGPLYLLGERAFNFYTPNIAKINLGSLGLILRPYSTFSHPNSLAGYLLLVLIILKWCKKVPSLRRSATPPLAGQAPLVGGTKDGSATFGGLQPLTEIFISLAIILTFSKIAMLTLVLLQIKNIKIIKKIIFIAILSGFLPLLVNFTSLRYTPDNSFLSRAYMGYPALKIIKQNFLTGTGLRGFIPSLSKHLSPAYLNNSSLQPVHSLPLLMLSEIGVFGFVWLMFVIRRLNIKNLLLAHILLVVFVTGAVDHYWWTLPQNQLLLVFALTLPLLENQKKPLSRF